MSDIESVIKIMERLRDPQNGCPWDLQQNFQSIAPYTIEEAYEVADAIEHNDPDELCLELGDLLFQVVFHSRLAQEQGWFDFEDVVAAIRQKLIQRHPHVFSDASVESAQAQSQAWEKHKQRERENKNYASQLDGIAKNLPALNRAYKLQKRAANVNFDWDDAQDVIKKVNEEIAELEQAVKAKDTQNTREELGDLLFSVVNLTRHLDVDPETALRSANQKFERRFRKLEQRLKSTGKSIEALTIKDLNAVWDELKSEEK